MSSDIKNLGAGKFKRKVRRKLGLFIDGVGLDRATRRISRKVDLQKFVAGLTEGLVPSIARYYTLIPCEDDARQLAFLDAVSRAGMDVVHKRLPPKHIKRPVAVDVSMATDILTFSFGAYDNPELSLEESVKAPQEEAVQRIALIVCPSRELIPAIETATRLGVKTSLADFGLYGSSDDWRGIDRWIDLSTSETIWRD
ncbi:MAG: NYN domain-containing protein [bacterium]|nr:NYN domain-containing protein [bacterium]